MTLERVPARDLPGLNPIARGHVTGAPAVREMLPDPPERDVITGRAREARAAFEGRAHDAHPLGSGARALVLAGQQVGLFLGPLLVPVKAAATILLARDLSARGVPTEAGFWCASEDHDLVEVTRVGLPAEGGVLEAGPEAEPLRGNRRPVGALPLPPRAAEILEAAREGLGAPADPEALEAIRATLGGDGGPTFLGAFLRQLDWLFAGDGLVTVDAADPALKRVALPLAARLVRERAEVRRLLEERAACLRDRALPLQVTSDPSALPLFALVEGERFLLVESSGRLRLKGHPDDAAFDAEEVVARFESSSWLPSFSALSRPVLASWLFPVAATVLGPAEIAYWAQAFPLFGWAGVVPPVLVPRPMVAPIAPPIARSLGKLDLGLADVLTGAEPILRARGGKGARAAVGAVQALGQRTREGLDALGEPLASVDPTLGKALATTREKVDFALAKLAERVAEAAGRADEAYARQLARVIDAIVPGGVPAERAHSTLPYLLRHGRAGLVEPLLAQVRWDVPGLQPLMLS